MRDSGFFLFKQSDQRHLRFHSFHPRHSREDQHRFPREIRNSNRVMGYHRFTENEDTLIYCIIKQSFPTWSRMFVRIKWQRNRWFPSSSNSVETLIGDEISMPLNVCRYEASAIFELCKQLTNWRTTFSTSTLFCVATPSFLFITTRPHHEFITPVSFRWGSSNRGTNTLSYIGRTEKWNHWRIPSKTPASFKACWNWCLFSGESVWCVQRCRETKTSSIVEGDDENWHDICHYSDMWTVFQRDEAHNSREYEMWHVDSKSDQ